MNRTIKEKMLLYPAIVHIRYNNLNIDISHKFLKFLTKAWDSKEMIYSAPIMLFYALVDGYDPDNDVINQHFNIYAEFNKRNNCIQISVQYLGHTCNMCKGSGIICNDEDDLCDDTVCYLCENVGFFRGEYNKRCDSVDDYNGWIDNIIANINLSQFEMDLYDDFVITAKIPEIEKI